MTKRPTESEVMEVVVDNASDLSGIAKEQIDASTSFVNDLGFDSLDVVGIITDVEEELDIDILESDDDVTNTIQTVGDVARLAYQLVLSKPGE